METVPGYDTSSYWLVVKVVARRLPVVKVLGKRLPMVNVFAKRLPMEMVNIPDLIKVVPETKDLPQHTEAALLRMGWTIKLMVNMGWLTAMTVSVTPKMLKQPLDLSHCRHLIKDLDFLSKMATMEAVNCCRSALGGDSTAIHPQQMIHCHPNPILPPASEQEPQDAELFFVVVY
ncbi:unnamed protein product, partial [Brenthis ino]